MQPEVNNREVIQPTTPTVVEVPKPDIKLPTPVISQTSRRRIPVVTSVPKPTPVPTKPAPTKTSPANTTKYNRLYHRNINPKPSTVDGNLGGTGKSNAGTEQEKIPERW